jgi:hypothetical protein
VTLADGLTQRFHANQMGLGSTQVMDDKFTAFADAFNLPVRPPRVAKEELDTWMKIQWTTIKKISNHGTPPLDEVKPSSRATHCRNPVVLNKVTFHEFDPKKKNIQASINGFQWCKFFSFGFSKKGRCWYSWL